MNWVQINIRVNEDFRYMKIHITITKIQMSIASYTSRYEIVHEVHL